MGTFNVMRGELLPVASGGTAASTIEGARTSLSVYGKSETYTQAEVQSLITSSLTSYAPLASPAFTGVPTVPTAASTINNTQAASTAFVQEVVSINRGGKQTFSSSGTFTVPDTVTTLWVSGVGGGGHGYDGTSAVQAGTTSFGSYLSWAGGSDGQANRGGIAGGAGGQTGVFGAIAKIGGYGRGGNSVFNPGGTYDHIDGLLGSGGCRPSTEGGGGSGAGSLYNEITVTPGENITVTIGAGNIASGSSVGDGGDGFVLVEW